MHDWTRQCGSSDVHFPWVHARQLRHFRSVIDSVNALASLTSLGFMFDSIPETLLVGSPKNLKIRHRSSI